MYSATQYHFKQVQIIKNTQKSKGVASISFASIDFLLLNDMGVVLKFLITHLYEMVLDLSGTVYYFFLFIYIHYKVLTLS